MKRLTSDDAAAVKPTRPTETNPAGYFDDSAPDGGTIIRDYMLNAFQDEMYNILLGAGVAEDPDDDSQLSAVLGGAYALVSAATDTGKASSINTRVVIASENGRAYGDCSAVIASNGPAAIRSMYTEAECSAIIACLNDGALHDFDIQYTGGGGVEAALAAIACYSENDDGLKQFHMAGRACLAAACGFDGDGVAPEFYAIESAMLAGHNNAINATRAAILASEECENYGDNSAILASNGLSNSTDNCLIGGVSGAKWRISSATGDMDIVSGAGFNVGGLDFAEYFENLESGELPPGSLVSLAGDKVRLAQTGDTVDGVISRTASLIGNAQNLQWKDAFIQDEFGALVFEEVEFVRFEVTKNRRLRKQIDIQIPATAPKNATFYTDKNGLQCAAWLEDVDAKHGFTHDCQQEQQNHIPQNAMIYNKLVFHDASRRAFYEKRAKWIEFEEKSCTETIEKPLAEVSEALPENAEYFTRKQPVKNPFYDPEKAYIPRSERPEEWSVVGLLGRLLVRVDEKTAAVIEAASKTTARVFIEAAADGLGTQSTAPTNLRALKLTEDFDPVDGYGIALCLMR